MHNVCIIPILGLLEKYTRYQVYQRRILFPRMERHGPKPTPIRLRGAEEEEKGGYVRACVRACAPPCPPPPKL